MRIFVSFLFSLILLYGCNRNACDKNHYIDLKFRYSIDIIALSENGQDVFIEDKLDAMHFLRIVSGHVSQIQELEYPLYHNRDLYLQDHAKWKEWYAKYRCSLSEHEIDSLLLVYKSQ